MTQKINTDELRNLAEAATPGPWISSHHEVKNPRFFGRVASFSCTTGQYESERDNRDFIAAANPEQVIALLDRIAELEAKLAKSLEGLKFYAEKDHFYMHDPDAWDTVSGEPINFWEDESNTATVEDGSIAKLALEAISAMEKGEES